MSGQRTAQCWCGALLGTKGHPDPHPEPPPVPGTKVRVPRGLPENPHVYYPGLNQPGESGRSHAAAHSHGEHSHGHAHDLPRADGGQPAAPGKPAPPPAKGKGR
jgi:hypothetical protein